METKVPKEKGEEKGALILTILREVIRIHDALPGCVSKRLLEVDAYSRTLERGSLRLEVMRIHDARGYENLSTFQLLIQRARAPTPRLPSSVVLTAKRQT